MGTAALMPFIYRVLDPTPCTSLRAYINNGGGEALFASRRVNSANVIDAIERSGLRGRGGAGFPTARKWRSVLTNASPDTPTPVVINGAEGEPSTFKDRTILRNNPYRVLEGALIACAVVQAEELVICMKRSFTQEWDAVTSALNEMVAEGWMETLRIRRVAGPSAYLFGEETALLEVVGHRQPFPRVTPPWRRGVDEVGDSEALSATAQLASPIGTTGAPALVNNVETFANVALIVRYGPDWFREIGTDESPGSLVCTMVGDLQRHGVAEFAMGTPLRTVIEELGAGAQPGRHIIAVLPGASSAVVGETLLDTPLTHESLKAVGSALGSAGFHCVDDAADTFALAYGAARFLSVESCGQCSPCKEDGLAVTALLQQLLDGTAPPDVEKRIAGRLATVTNEARCSLATQTQVVVGSLVTLCAVAQQPTRLPDLDATERVVAHALLPLVDIVDGLAIYDERHAAKQPDWTYELVDSGSFPAQRLQGEALETEPDER